jgi:hypothetical protein
LEVPEKRGKPFPERVPLVGIAEEIDHDRYRNQDQYHFSHGEITPQDLSDADDGAERATGGSPFRPEHAASGGDSMLPTSAIIVWQQGAVWQLSQITATYSRRTSGLYSRRDLGRAIDQNLGRPCRETKVQHLERADAPRR